MKTIAFIPVRGGSKSIPFKNIKSFCGKPLVCWNIEALEACNVVDQVIVATDSDAIEKVILARNYKKTFIYRRSAENACDNASTESVMLEYINNTTLNGDDVFMLVQATSPLTQEIHFSEALSEYQKSMFDSMLTCVRIYRFLWNSDGTSKNYDYMNRPRRQDFDGELMENGAFYINKVKNILSTGNRISGNIGIYIMPEYTATEIDEPDDWSILENLMNKHVLANCCFDKSQLKLFITDVDGTLTDGGMYYSENGDEMKKFNTRDGMGLQILRETGVKIAIITSENTGIVNKRANKLQVDFLIQGKRNGGKLAVAQDLCAQLSITMNQVAYIGDDVNCFELLSEAGIKACPADATDKIKSIKGINVMTKKGGEGCVREFIEFILKQYSE
jgi:N-acylneuraminate cytidylyltransferase